MTAIANIDKRALTHCKPLAVVVAQLLGLLVHPSLLLALTPTHQSLSIINSVRTMYRSLRFSSKSFGMSPLFPA
jgi:hypothetical protein